MTQSDLHYNDTIKAGDGLCDPESAAYSAYFEAPDRISDLVTFGVPFDTVNGAIALTMEAAHSVPRFFMPEAMLPGPILKPH